MTKTWLVYPFPSLHLQYQSIDGKNQVVFFYSMADILAADATRARNCRFVVGFVP